MVVGATKGQQRGTIGVLIGRVVITLGSMNAAPLEVSQRRAEALGRNECHWWHTTDDQLQELSSNWIADELKHEFNERCERFCAWAPNSKFCLVD